MSEPAKIEPQMLHPDQVSVQNEQEKPWLRQKHEPANWYMRFKCYLDLGPKRSLRAVVAADPVAGKATEGNKKQQQSEQKKATSAVASVPGAWSRAAKVWNWKERAQAYDLKEQAREAQLVRDMANDLPHASRPYRIIRLEYLARVLAIQLEPEKLKGVEVKTLLALTTRYQSVLRDIEKEMQGLEGVARDACDSAALVTVKEAIIEQKYRASLKSNSVSEQNKAAFEKQNELDKLRSKR